MEKKDKWMGIVTLSVMFVTIIGVLYPAYMRKSAGPAPAGYIQIEPKDQLQIIYNFRRGLVKENKAAIKKMLDALDIELAPDEVALMDIKKWTLTIGKIGVDEVGKDTQLKE